MKNLAVITARGGSKRIPKKNIRPFLGTPIIVYSIRAALASGLFETVMVSTDSEEIAQIAREAGAEVPFLRSSDTASDFATTADVIGEVIAAYEAMGQKFDTFTCLYPTAPFVTASDLQEAYRILLGSEDVDAVVPVVRFSFPPQRAFTAKDGILAYAHPEFRSARSQDLEPLYHDAGQFYAVRTKAFEAEHTVVPAKSAALVLPEEKVQDIDNEEDWILAEIKFQRITERERG